MKKLFSILFSILMMLTICVINVSADDIVVSTTEEAQAALDNAQEGNTIVLEAGNYSTLYLRNNGESDCRTIKDVTLKVSNEAIVNITDIRYQKIEGKSLDIENLTIDGFVFNDPTKTAIWFDYNTENSLRINGLTIQNCKKNGDKESGSSYEKHAFLGCYYDSSSQTNTKFAGNNELEVGYHNIVVDNNEISNIIQPIQFPNNDLKDGLKITNNYFKDCIDNIIQISGGKNKGNYIITNNTIENIYGRFARIAGISADSSFTISNNLLINPKVYDLGDSHDGSDGDGTIVKITGVNGFTVNDQANDWAIGSYTDQATWKAFGPVAKIDDNKYSTLQDAIDVVQDGETITMLCNVTVNAAVNNLVGKTFTIDLNDTTMSTKKDDAFTINNTNLTVKNGTINHTVTWEPFFLNGDNEGSLTLDSVNITSPMYSAYISSSSKNKILKINDCNFVSTGDGVIYAGGADTSNIINITNSTLSNSNANTATLQLASKATLENVAITSTSATALVCYENTDLLVKGNDSSFVGAKGSIHTNGSKDLVQITIEDGTFKSTSNSDEDGIAFYHPDGSPLTIKGGTFEGATALYVKGGIIDIQGGTFIGKGEYKTAQKVSSGAKATGDAVVIEASGYLAQEVYNPDPNPSVSISGGFFKSDKGSPIAYYTFDGNKEAHNGKMISGGYFNKTINADIICPGYECINTPQTDEHHVVYPYMIGKRTSGNVVITETDDDVPKYYEKVVELQDAIDNITKANQEKFDNNKSVNVSTITINNGSGSTDGIKAEIDDTVKIIANENTNNQVKADPGYKLNNPVTEGGKTTYTANSLDIGKDYQGGADGTGKTDSKKTQTTVEDSKIPVTQEVIASAATVNDTIANKQLENIVSQNLNNILDNRGINQGIAARTLNNANIKVTNEGSVGTTLAKNVNVYVTTYYETEVVADNTSNVNKSYALDITPMYQAYASTAANKDSMNVGVDSIKIGNSLPVDCTGKTITLKIKLAQGFITSVDQKVYVVHTTKGGSRIIYDTKVTKVENDFYIEFTNSDGFSVFEITTKDPRPTPSPKYNVPNTGIK